MNVRNPRLIIVLIIGVLLLCVVGYLAYSVITNVTGQDVAVGEPTAGLTATAEEASQAGTIPAAGEEVTPTSTRVLPGEADGEATGLAPTGEPGVEATVEAAPAGTRETEASASATSTPSSASTEAGTPERDASAGRTEVSTITRVETEEVTQQEEVLKNGSFEEGFDSMGVGLTWGSFRTADAAINFSAETATPFIAAGAAAQRISLDKATVPDQYGGIYQTVEVKPGQVYTLTLNGQIRSKLGSVEASSYGYRLQYAFNYNGAVDWQSLPADAWVELPFDEQSLEASEYTFGRFTTQVTPTGGRMTLFIRAWNKWADQSLGEYTLDDLSLMGPVTRVTTRTVTVPLLTSAGAPPASSQAGSSSQASGEEEMIDQPLPTTGVQLTALSSDSRLWGAVIVLTLLALGAIVKSGWRW